MPDELDVVAFATVEELWSWIEVHHATHPGVWVRLQKTSSDVPSAGFHDLLEADGRMTPAGRKALGR